ncbi:hypothetical protein BROUX41_002569 [Berkeleyomyces rouxiae]|uniref:uncharacterized protein n=1 Tax=Berkeleyomyces rouxiae TaxID=2035830 RepID=UPI003B7C5C2E
MQILDILSGLALSSLVSSAPDLSSTRPATVPTWTLTDVSRSCTETDDECTYSFGIDSSIHDTVQCEYSVSGQSASSATVTDALCGPFTINSSWNGQFGVDAAFTIISVTDGKYIAWPAYTDQELDGGNVVQPDRAYEVYSVADL